MDDDRERARKRENSINQNDEEEDLLQLTLSTPCRRLRQPSPPLPPPPPPPTLHLPPFTMGIVRDPLTSAIGTRIGPAPRRSTRRNSSQAPHGSKEENVPPPFPWAANHRATVHSFDHLISAGIRTISGEFQCKKCEARDETNYDLQTKFAEVANFIHMRKYTMHDRAPSEWLNPMLPDCRFCQQKECMKPVISNKKRSINWLFLLLGQMLGCCTLEQLKYFCKHTKNHRTGAKDRVLYLAYLGLCKQLNPNGPFDR